MTVRVKFGKKVGERESSVNPTVMTDFYKVTLEDLNIKASLMLKSTKKQRVEFKVGDCYLVDKIKIVVN